MSRKNISSGTEWEDLIGYSRAIKIGNRLEFAGTTAVDGHKVISPGDFYDQTKYILTELEKIALAHGFTFQDVIRTRVYVTSIGKWEEVSKAHSEFFKDVKPVSTMVEVSALIHPDIVVEIELSLEKA